LGSLDAMPTAAEYDIWTLRLGALADELTGVTAPVAGSASAEAISGGLTAVTVDVAVRAAQANSLAAAGLLRELADECTRRAGICADYAAAMEEYGRRSEAYQAALVSYLEAAEAAEAGGSHPGSPPLAPSEPLRPYGWVER
jgi:hypothetical protein